ncbi:MAG: carboxypeptidase regulatory-like domain-containing protein [Blastocatellia bacterium]
MLQARLLSAVLLLFVCVLPVCSATAQTVSGSIEGRVYDTNNAIIPGVKVVVRNTETGQERTVTTNAEGFFQAIFMPIGPYRVTASSNGFATTTLERVEISLNQTATANLTLQPAGASNEITITTEATPINTTDAEVKQSLNAQAILDKPTLNPGSFLSLAEIFTGFQENPTSGQNNPTASSGSSINFNGTGSRGATFQINGVNNDDSSENQNRQGAALSTIREFQVITNNFTAEFGRGYGAVVLVQTKSGTNKVHGDAYEFHQDSAMNAKSFFTPGTVKKPVNRRNQYGGTLGGPILRDRLLCLAVSIRNAKAAACCTPATCCCRVNARRACPAPMTRRPTARSFSPSSIVSRQTGRRTIRAATAPMSAMSDSIVRCRIIPRASI